MFHRNTLTPLSRLITYLWFIAYSAMVAGLVVIAVRTF